MFHVTQNGSIRRFRVVDAEKVGHERVDENGHLQTGFQRHQVVQNFDSCVHQLIHLETGHRAGVQVGQKVPVWKFPDLQRHLLRVPRIMLWAYIILCFNRLYINPSTQNL